MSDELLAIFNALDDTPVKRENYLRAPFSYVGSKDSSLHLILPLLPHRDTFVEVFGGSGRVTLARRKCKLEVFNDKHSGVTAFYRCIQSNDLLDRLIERLQFLIHSREEFIWCASTWENCEDDVERAARWYYTAQCSFAGRGEYFGRVIKGKGMMSEKLRSNLPFFGRVHERFQDIQVENLDWRECFKDYDGEDTVFYLDPPYFSGAKVYKHHMSQADHIEMCERIFQLKGFVALSGYYNEVYMRHDWNGIHKFYVHDNIVTQATETNTSVIRGRIDIDRGERAEYLWIKEAN